MGYTVNEYVSDLRRLRSEGLVDNAMAEAVKPLAKKLAEDGSWLTEKMSSINSDMGVGISVLHEEHDQSLNVIVVAWGEKDLHVPPHDHGTWAVVAGVRGIERNTLWDRQDDGSHEDPDYAEVAAVSHTDISLGDVISMETRHIHTVDNIGEGISLSLHTYGQNPNTTERFQYDTKTNRKKVLKVNFG
ncbi:MAG: hypothetical protein KUG75_06240 [Pseudomonadales bacterium]|nr:hypothetical protein [Pseudomonadales bacterium]